MLSGETTTGTTVPVPEGVGVPDLVIDDVVLLDGVPVPDNDGEAEAVTDEEGVIEEDALAPVESVLVAL